MKKTLIAIASIWLVAAATALAQPASENATAEAAPPASPPRPPISINVFELIEKLSKEMNKEFILDQRMAGIYGGTTASADDADYETLLGILRENGWAAIETADQILIVPDASTRSQPQRVLQKDDRNVSDHEIVTRIVDVPDYSNSDGGAERPGRAAQLVPILRPLISQYGNLAPLAGTNKLLITDRYDNVRRISAIIEGLDD